MNTPGAHVHAQIGIHAGIQASDHAQTGVHSALGRLMEHFTWNEGATLVAALLGAVVTVLGVLMGIAANAGAARRDRRAEVYAEALRAVADYLEGPYRVRRKDGTSERRDVISTHLNDVKTRIDYSKALLELHAPAEVSTAYNAYVAAAVLEAGKQMQDAWLLRPVKKDRQMNLGVPYPRDLSDPLREPVVAAMKRDLKAAWWHRRR